MIASGKLQDLGLHMLTNVEVRGVGHFAQRFVLIETAQLFGLWLQGTLDIAEESADWNL